MNDSLGSAADPEMARWAEAWNAEDPEHRPISASARRAIRRRVRFQGLGLVAITALEILLCLGVLGWAVRLAMLESTAVQWSLVAALVVLLVVAEAVTLWNRRGTWRPRNQSIDAFVELEALRLRRQLRTATRLVPGVYIAELIVLVPWRIWALRAAGEWSDQRLMSLLMALAVATGSLVVFCGVWAWQARRRGLAAEATLEALRATETLDEMA